MKTVKQLLRQPLKTAIGIALMALAAAILCLCVGQALAAYSTKEDLDGRFSTAAILSLQEDLEGLHILTAEQELIDWLEEMAQLHPDIVQGVIRHGILSAAIPELVPYNALAESVPIPSESTTIHYPTGATANFYGYDSDTNYDSAMLVITLEEIGQVLEPGYWPEELPLPVKADFETEEEYALAKLAYEAYWEEHADMYYIDQQTL